MRRPSPIQPPRRPESGAPADAEAIDADQPFVSPFRRAPQRGRKADETPARSAPQRESADGPAAGGEDQAGQTVGIRDV
ncbi:MAG TPA: hypothetical protein VN107_05800, partial [Microbacterium sp.]|nr:hypothetical protein [Microbacterium sp.]